MSRMNRLSRCGSVSLTLCVALIASTSRGQSSTSKPAEVKPAAPAQPTGKPSAAELVSPLAPGAKAPGATNPQPTVTLKPGEVPAIHFDTPTYDFGRAKGGTVVKNEYTFTNKGNGPLELLAVRPSCGCTTAGDYTKVVAPGQSGKIPIQLNTGKNVGPLTKSVTVITNCPAPDSTVTLQIKGEVWQVIEVTPQSASFGKIEDQTKMEKTLVITNNTETPLKLTDLKSSNPIFRAETREVEPGKKYELVVTALPPFAPGSNNAKITMTTNNTDVPILEVQAYAFVPQVVEVSPMQISVPATASVATKRQLQVRHHDKSALKITNLTCNNPAVTCSLNEQVPGQTFQIVVDIPAGYVPQPSGDRVTFATNSASMPNVTIPIMPTGFGATATRMPAMAGAANPAATKTPAAGNTAPAADAAKAKPVTPPSGGGTSAPH